MLTVGNQLLAAAPPVGLVCDDTCLLIDTQHSKLSKRVCREFFIPKQHVNNMSVIYMKLFYFEGSESSKWKSTNDKKIEKDVNRQFRNKHQLYSAPERITAVHTAGPAPEGDTDDHHHYKSN